ncbi:MAG: phosphoribosylamine--glycine ligase [Gemmatimonadetes bacterium]|nr:phosphoribosylamine--glycine ligase [Gemmatimonadota bacterium]|tara:strand:+ start:3010 stop:4287 length:1278 start_codon:yes stop_codon:yes gene_type:complete
MRILIVGNGGREHALLWKLRRDAPAASFFATQPNGGMVSDCEHLEIEANDVDSLSSWAKSNQIDLTIVGPEAPLAAGIVDHFEKVGLPIFGPHAKAARIESSKAYSKELMRNAGIPTAEHRTFTDLSTAEAWILRQGAPIVVKASGLAAGKGAVVCTTEQEALSAVRSMLGDFIFGEAGREVVIEEFLEGEELSVFALTDGEHSVILQPSQDHKRVGEGDKGPNTGGMGAYAPVSIATPELMAEVGSRIIQPTLRALAEDGSPFQGLLYAGLIKTESGLQVIEFNCRFGDPETQVVLPLMQDSLLDLIATVAEGGRLQPGVAAARTDAAVTTVVASGGYPSSYEKSKEIIIPRQLESENCIVFHAGTIRREGQLLTSGGRVLAVTALAPSISEAAEASADAAGQIEFEGAFHRSDIGWRERLRQD